MPRTQIPSIARVICYSGICALATLGVIQPWMQARPRALRDRLQDAATRAMAEQSGTAVVLDVKSGEILAQVRPEVAARRLARPGSALKPFTLLALLEAGRLSPGERIRCLQKVRLAGRDLNCSHPQVSEAMDARAALAYSCNYYFTRVAARFEKGEMSATLARAGLTSPTGLMTPEAAGHAEPVGMEAQQLQAVGEAAVEVTPLELVNAYRKLALRRREAASSPALATVFAGLEDSASYGMGRLATPLTITISGKTGTATADEGSWTHAWFVGFAPADDPEIVLVVFLEKGRGGTGAASVAHDIFEAYASARRAP
jgi:cell division protein FtsI/penicillin-binding protein 2